MGLVFLKHFVDNKNHITKTGQNNDIVNLHRTCYAVQSIIHIEIQANYKAVLLTI